VSRDTRWLSSRTAENQGFVRVLQVERRTPRGPTGTPKGSSGDPRRRTPEGTLGSEESGEHPKMLGCVNTTTGEPKFSGAQFAER